MSSYALGSGGVTFKTLYSFGAQPDGAIPFEGLVDVDGTLYGTTFGGGAGGCGAGGCGTVFKISTGGAESVLHSFTTGTDGENPFCALIDVNGTLYGTTSFGGQNGNGTVFAIRTSGAETVIHRFAGGKDGAIPQGGLVNVNGVLFGTTGIGGASGNGTVFKIDASGAESVVYSFKGGPDGSSPYGTLAYLNGMLYGTTYAAGSKACFGYGCGTVFKVSTSGTESVLHIFKGEKDGSNPEAGVTAVNGTLYGTTLRGGGFNNCPGGCGTVFKVDSSDTYSLLYRFKGGFKGASDGAGPSASLLDVNGALYGTTTAGGGVYNCQTACGTVFEVSTTGVESVLHAFAKADGANPFSTLINVNGTLYGTTAKGGTTDHGTVFALTR